MCGGVALSFVSMRHKKGRTGTWLSPSNSLKPVQPSIRKPTSASESPPRAPSTALAGRARDTIRTAHCRTPLHFAAMQMWRADAAHAKRKRRGGRGRRSTSSLGAPGGDDGGEPQQATSLAEVAELEAKGDEGGAGSGAGRDVHSPDDAVGVDMIKLLVSNGANLEATDVEGYTPLHWACRKGRVEAAYCLLELGADLYVWRSGDPTIGASVSPPLATVDTLPGNARGGGAVPRGRYAKNLYGSTALHLAVMHNHLDMVIMLTRRDCEVGRLKVLRRVPVERQPPSVHRGRLTLHPLVCFASPAASP